MRWAAGLRAAMVAAALAAGLTRCSSPPARPVDALPPQSPSQSPSPSVAPAGAQAEIQRAIDAFNGKAGGSVSGQQAVLADLLDEGQRAEQDRCAAATTTLEFEPVYARLAPSPGWKPSHGALYGTVYALPTLIRIYTGNRITGTDLTDLHVAIQDGQARLPALCLS